MPKSLEKGTIRFDTYEEFDQACKDLDWQVVSPGGAANMLHVSRAYIHQLEKDKRIRALRVRYDKISNKNFSRTLRLLITPPKYWDYIFIPVVDVEEIKEEMERRKKAKGKE